MTLPSPFRHDRPALAAALLAALAAGAWASAVAPAGSGYAGHHTATVTTDVAFPAGTITVRTVEGQLPDPDRGRWSPARRHGAGASPPDPAPFAASALPSSAPAGAAWRALERAGRLAAPSTGPPTLS